MNLITFPKKRENMKIKIFIIAFLLCSAIITYSAPRKVLFEFSTSTGCQYCACMDSVLKKHILVSHPQTAVLAYHGNELPHIDPYSNFIGETVRDSLLGPEVGFSAPCAFIDRSFFYRVSYPFAYDSVAYRYSNSGNAPVQISFISKEYNSSTRTFTLTAELKALQNLSGNLRVNFVILENNLLYYQQPGPCGGSPNNDWDHDWVTRSMANGWDGELIVNGNWNANQTYTKNFNTPIDTGWVANNCEFVVFVYNRISSFRHSEILQAEKGSVTGSIGIKHINTLCSDYYLYQNYPNPFNPKTNIKFSIPKNENVNLKIYNILGREIAELFNGKLEAGIYNAEFTAEGLPGGVYFYILKTDNFSYRKKMVVLK